MGNHKEISVSIPIPLLNRLDLHFYDPAMDKPAYGTRSQLITKLLTEWLEEEYDRRCRDPVHTPG